MSFAPNLTCDVGLGRDALTVGSGLKPEVDRRRWHSLQESARAQSLGNLLARVSPKAASSSPNVTSTTIDAMMRPLAFQASAT
jgi:hypothetical protein